MGRTTRIRAIRVMATRDTDPLQRMSDVSACSYDLLSGCQGTHSLISTVTTPEGDRKSLPADSVGTRWGAGWRFHPTVVRIGLIIGLILLAASFRFYAISTRGLVLYDEGQYSLESQFWYTGIHYGIPQAANVLAGRSSIADATKRLRQEVRGSPPSTNFKPGHVAMLTIGRLILGDRDYAGPVMSALLGTLTVVLVYFMGRKLFHSERAALLSAGALAVSSWHVGYSRSALAEADTLFWLAAATWVYCSDWPRPPRSHRLYLASLLLGIAILTNFRAIPFFAIFTFYELYHARSLVKHWNLEKLRRLVKRTLALWAATMLPLLLLGLPLWAFQNVFRAYVFDKGPSFLEQIATFVVAGGPGSRLSLNGLFTYPTMIWIFEGAFVSLLVLVGVVALIRGPGRVSVVIGAQWLPFAYYSVIATRPPFFDQRARFVSTSLLAIALTAGWGAEQLCRLAKRRSANLEAIVVVVLLAGLAITGGVLTTRAVSVRSNVRNVLAYLSSYQPGIGIQNTNSPVWLFYLWKQAQPVPQTRQEVSALQSQGYELLVTDQQKMVTHWVQDKTSRVIQELEAACSPEYESRYELGDQVWALYVLENCVKCSEMAIAMAKGGPEAIGPPRGERWAARVYDLNRCPGSASPLR